MAISYNTGATSTATGVAHTVNQNITVPAGVLIGDLMLLSISVFTFTPTGADFTLTAASGHTWTVLGPGVVQTAVSGGLVILSKEWARSATSGDPSDTLTLAFTGTQGATDQFWWAISLDSWTGASGVDVVATPTSGAGGGYTAQPTKNTLTAGDWEVDILATGIDGSGFINAAPSGKTLRHSPNTAGITVGVADSNASVGAAGTTIGGGAFTASSTIDWWVAWTIGLAPPSTSGPSYTASMSSM